MQTPLFEVTAAAASGDPRRLTTAANVRALIGSPIADDAVITAIIDRVSAAFAAYCGLAADTGGTFPTFGAETCRATWYVDHLMRDPLLGRTSPLRLPWRKPITITSVTENGTALVAGTDFVLEAGALLYRLSLGQARIRWPGTKVVVVYTAGYSLPTSVPPDLEAAAIEQVKFRYRSRRRDQGILSEVVPDVHQVSYGDQRSWMGEGGLLDDVESALSPYKNWASQ